jgi:Ribonuclease G/E
VHKLAPEMRGTGLLLKVNPEVARALGEEESGVLRDLAAMVGAEITVKADPLLHQEQFDVVARPESAPA